ncbi:MAG TPA: hypothetical protein VK506_12935 [Conexibacter sp.]|nr:hypothetical protein [Conexibacter sp.]
MAEGPAPRPRLVAAVCAAAIVLGAVGALLPALLEDDVGTSSTPVRRDLVAHDVTLAPDQRVCVANVALDRDSAVARLRVRRVPAAGATLRVVATGPGHRAAGIVVLGAQGASAEGAAVDVPLAPPPRSLVGTLCMRHEGGGTVELVGTDHPRATVRSSASLDGVPLRQAPSVSLLQARERSTLARTSELVDRAAALSPFGPWLFWALIPLLLLGLPALVVTALWRAMAADEPSPER